MDAAALTLQQFDADVERLDAAGQVAKLRGYALAFLGAASTGGLEILVGDANKAYKLAATYCDGFFSPPLYGRHWKIRVHLLDGTVAARCTIKSARP